MDRLAVDFLGRRFKNPFLPASGCYANAKEAENWHDLEADWGGLISKSVSLLPKSGNQGIRIAEAPAGLLNSIGLQNPGIDVFTKEYLPFLLAKNENIIVNIAASENSEYLELVEILNDYPLAAIEVNLSCPNVSAGCMAIGTNALLAEELMNMLSNRSKHPLIAKLSPNVADIVPIVKAVEAGGARAISLVNTYLGLSIDLKRRRPMFKRNFAGYSGPGIQPLALRLAAIACQHTKLPVIGIGGISTAEDVASFIMVGCSLVQVGAALLREPCMIKSLLKDFSNLLEELGFQSVAELRDSIEWNQP